MVANANLPSNLMSIPATSAHLWPAGTLPAGSVTYPGRIFVGGLTSERNLEGEVKEEDLINFFATFGKVTEVKKILDHEDGTFRGFAFVTFADKSSADKVFELYSDASQRHQFVIKGMDLKIGHAVKKGNGPSGITNPAGLPINPLAAQLKLGQSLYNQQLLAAQLYCNPYSYLGVAASPMPVSPDPLLSGGLLYANPGFALQQPAPAAVVPNLPQVKLSTSPVATQSLASPVSVSSALLKPFEGQDSPTSRNGFPTELPANDLAAAAGINPSQPSIPMTQGGGGMMSPLSVASTDVLNLASTTSPALINSYSLRCPNPLAYPYGCVAAPAIPGLTSTQTQPACNGLDQNYLNSFYCFPPNGAFLGSPLASIPGQIPTQNMESHTPVTGTDSGYLDGGNKTSSNLPLIPEDHVTKAMAFPPGVVAPPSMPVQFANTSCVENLSLAGISRPLATTME